MAELAHLLHRGAARMTPQIARGIYKKLPLLKVEFAQLDAPHFPHLVGQLQFLANFIEDFMDGKADEVPYVTFASACYALIYARRHVLCGGRGGSPQDIMNNCGEPIRDDAVEMGSARVPRASARRLAGHSRALDFAHHLVNLSHAPAGRRDAD